MDFAKERIEHLTKEIASVTANMMIFRTRIGFTVVIGPFFVMGSVLFATGGRIEMPTPDAWFIGCAIAGAFCYLGLALYGSQLDKHMSQKCNDWRKAIMSLSQGDEPEEETILSQQCFPTWLVYLLGFVLVLIASMSVTYCVSQVLPEKQSTAEIDLSDLAKPISCRGRQGLWHSETRRATGALLTTKCAEGHLAGEILHG